MNVHDLEFFGLTWWLTVSACTGVALIGFLIVVIAVAIISRRSRQP
jgi:hypothetical protein